MAFFAWVFVFVIPSMVFGALSKCCPLNYELSRGNSTTSHNFTCQLSTVGTLSITYTSDLRVGLPKCQQLRLVGAYEKDQKVACMDRIGELNDVYGLACVEDKVLDQGDSGKKKSTTSPADRHQHPESEPTDESSEDTGSQPRSQNSFRIGSVTNVRKCCPHYRKYAADRQFCWSDHSDNYTNALLDLLKISVRRTDRFANVTFGAPPCLPSKVLVDTVVPSQLVAFDDDALMLNVSQVYSFDEYCVDVVDDLFEYVAVRSCVNADAECRLKGGPCVRKCCPDGQQVGEHGGCVPSKRPLQLLFHNVTRSISGRRIVPAEARPAFVYGNPCPMGKYALDPSEADEAHVLTLSGNVFRTATRTVYDRNQYCVENRESHQQPQTLVCFEQTEPDDGDDYLNRRVKPAVTITCAAISALFLLVTFGIYLLLPSLRNLHGKLIMCFLMTSAVSYLTVVVQGSLPYKDMPQEICVIMGYIMQFTFLSSFSWLNIISYDIWSTFRAVRSAFLKKSNTFKRFSMLCLYGWGSSLLWTGITVLCQYTSIIGEKSIIKPDIGKFRCFFSEFGRSKLVFHVAPVLTMISFNVIIFIFTVKYCANIRAELKKSNNNYSLKRYSADKNELIINLKLFIVMGLNWSMELISLLFQPENRTFFVISDVMNALKGVFIFCIFILKRKVLLDLKAKCCGKRSKGRTFERATGLTASTTSSIVMNFLHPRRSVSLNP